MRNTKDFFIKAAKLIAVLIFWLIVWEVIFLAVKKEVLVPSPFSVAAALFRLCGKAEFWLSIGVSLSRILLGLFAGTVIGCIFAAITSASSFAKLLLSPLLQTIKATPVASFIILALIWLEVGNVPILTAMLVVIPGVWANVERGILSIDKELVQMANCFNVSKPKIFFKIAVPSIKPYFIAAVSTAIGMAWKAGIAAEVICPYKNSIGTALHDSKIYFQTIDLFAWTVTVIILSMVLEKVILSIIEKGGKPGAQI